MTHPMISPERLMTRLRRLGEVGALPGGGVCRLALTDEDKAGRDLLVSWMKDLGLEVSIDVVGNIWGIRESSEAGAPIMMGSHIDTVATGGLFDGAAGVLVGLEVIEALNVAGAKTVLPVAVAAFTNEEGARFAPDMMGSGVHQGALDLEDMLTTVATDGSAVFGEELARIGYAGDIPPCSLTPAAYLELHVEQGPVLEKEKKQIGAVTGVQGISWTEFVIEGQSNHAGTTPMSMRHDAGAVAAMIALEARQIATDFGPPQVSTVGVFELSPGLVNVVPQRARLTVDLRNTSDSLLIEAESRLLEKAKFAAQAEGCTLQTRSLARFAPVEFDETLVAKVEAAAVSRRLSVKRMPSGAGHDAQMFAPNCPSAMIFVPSEAGLSHNIKENTEEADLVAGAKVLLDVILDLAGDAS